MCRCKLIQVRCYVASIGKSVTRDFTKPPGLEAWCPSCDDTDDTPESIAFDKHVVKELFEENCSMIKAVMDVDVSNKDEWLSAIPNTHKEMWNKIEELMSFNASLRNRLASKLVASEAKSFWKDVVITAPFMNTTSKKRLKNRIKSMNDVESIKEYLSQRFVVVNVSAKKESITIELVKEECNICFSAPVAKTPTCKTCKVSNMCVACALETIKRFGTCPFCGDPQDGLLKKF